MSRLIILGAVAFQLALLMPTVNARRTYRVQEQIEATSAFVAHPSAATKAAIDREVAFYKDHERWRRGRIVGACLFADIAAIYFFWNLGTRGTTGQHGAAPNGGPTEPLANSGACGGPPSVS
jgi:hypothetical protein